MLMDEIKNIDHYTVWPSQRKRKAEESARLQALCAIKTQESTAKTDNLGYPVQLMHKDDLQSIQHREIKVRTDRYQRRKYTDIYFEGVKDDIQFDGVLSADGVIYLACVGERDEYQDGND
jgi:hypothetical protein